MSVLSLDDGARALGRLGRASGSTRLARKLVLAILKHVEHGRVIVRDGRERFVLGNPSPELGLTVHVDVKDPRFWRRALWGGSVGAAESYVDGDFEVDDWVGLARVFARNTAALDRWDGRLTAVNAALRRKLHARRANTPRGSRLNAAAHYDLGNQLYALFLDESLTYSCALFEPDTLTLADAQRKKLDRICDELELASDDHLLEIGSGWGSMAIHAAAHTGCRVTTATISREQQRLAEARVRAAGLADRVRVVLADYRELHGRYDKLCSVEMIEAVGAEYYRDFFERASRLLVPGARFLLQAITLPDARYRAARDGVDFIKLHVFPGSCIPSLGVLSDAARAAGFRRERVAEIGVHYARTLAAWRERFIANADAVRALGYDERFIRRWTLYLALSEGAFAERYLGDAQLTLVKAG